MELFLQLWGGICYFLSKVFIVRSLFIQNDRNWRLLGWIIYLLGLPAWVILLISRQNWIASAIETAGLPAIILGIVLTWKQTSSPNKYVDWSIRIFTFFMIILGTFYSIYTFNGLRNISQILEIFIIFGYLVSNYLLAKKNPYAWLMFMVGLISMSTLMYIQGNIILCIQQIISMIPILIGFIKVLVDKRQNNC